MNNEEDFDDDDCPDDDSNQNRALPTSPIKTVNMSDPSKFKGNPSLNHVEPFSLKPDVELS